MSDERREFQRLNLTEPVDGWFGDYSVRLLDVSARGARIETEEDIALGSRAVLRFFWRDREVEITADTVRGDEGFAGLHFTEDNDVLRELLAASANDLLRAQEANASGQRELNILHGDETLTAASAGVLIDGYLRLSLASGVWKRKRALLPDQPEDGFTVAANESEEQIELLCKTYESGDADTRSMTRLFAELSVARR